MNLEVGGMKFSTPRSEMRDDFKKILKEEFRGILGSENSATRTDMEKAFAAILDESTKELNLDGLPEKTMKDLKGLAASAESFEAVFVKGLLTQMRKSSFAEKQGPYGEMARDFMDQAIAEQTASNSGGMGLASTVFRSMAPTLLREAPSLAARAAAAAAGDPQQTRVEPMQAAPNRAAPAPVQADKPTQSSYRGDAPATLTGAIRSRNS
jgi:Rod binding domain-containing protein